MQRRIIFVNRYFAPDHSATSIILSDLAFELAASGHEVHVVTGNQLYDDPNASLPLQENVRRVHITRVGSTRFGRVGLYGRSIDYLSLYISFYRAALALVRQGDVLVSKTDPPLVTLIMTIVARRRGAYLINWLQDLYPEVAIKLHVPFMRGPVGWVLSKIRDRSFKAAGINVAIGCIMAKHLRERGVDKDKIRVHPNWVNEKEIVPIAPSNNPLRAEWQLGEKFVVGYSGNLGRAHEFDTVLNAAERFKSGSKIVFLFIGGGSNMEHLKHAVADRGLEGLFVFRPYQRIADLKYSLSLPDIHWISLRPALEGSIVPSKVYGILAAGRPIIAIAAADGEIARLVSDADCGLTVLPGHAETLVNILTQLAMSKGLCENLGRNARTASEGRYSRTRAFDNWKTLLASIPSPQSTDRAAS